MLKTSVAFAVVLLGSLPVASGREYVIDGKVKSVDSKTYKVVIARDNGKESELQLVRDSEIRLDGKRTDWRVIKAKQIVRCVFDLDSKRIIALAIYDQIDRPPYRGER